MLVLGMENESHNTEGAGREHFAALKNLDLSFRQYYSHWPLPGPRECRFEILSAWEGWFGKCDAWLDASLVAGLKIIGKGLRLTILPEQPG